MKTRYLIGAGIVIAAVILATVLLLLLLQQNVASTSPVWPDVSAHTVKSEPEVEESPPAAGSSDYGGTADNGVTDTQISPYPHTNTSVLNGSVSPNQSAQANGSSTADSPPKNTTTDKEGQDGAGGSCTGEEECGPGKETGDAGGDDDATTPDSGLQDVDESLDGPDSGDTDLLCGGPGGVISDLDLSL